MSLQRSMHAVPAGRPRVPGRLPLGRGHRGVPDRGERRGRRPPARRSGTRSATRPGAQSAATPGTWPVDHYHRYRDDVAPDGRARAEGVPLLGRLAAGAADGPRRRQPGRAGLLPPARRRAARARHRAVADALPLGPAAAAGGRRRLAGARHRRTASPTTRCSCTTALGDRVRVLDHAERAVVLGVPRATPPARTPPAAPTRRLPCGPRTTCCSATGWPLDAVRGVAGRGRPPVRHHAEPVRRQRRRRLRGRRGRRPTRRRPAEPPVPGPACCAVATPTTCSSTWRRWASTPWSPTATWP